MKAALLLLGLAVGAVIGYRLTRTDDWYYPLYDWDDWLKTLDEAS